MFTVVKILELLPKEGSLEIKTLEKMLKLTKKIERTRLKIAINALNKLGILKKESDEHVKKGDLSNTVSAKIRCSSKGFSFAIRDDGKEDIYIREKYLNNAWHGDKVLVRINREALRRRSPEGIVLCVLERSKTNILATIKQTEGKIIGQPLDERILTNIELPNKDSKYIVDSEKENIIDIKIERYPIAQLLAKGETSRRLSLKEGPKGDVEILKTKHNILNKNNAPKVALKKPIDKIRQNLQEQKCLLLRSWNSVDSPLLPAVYSQPHDGGVKVWVHVPTIGERINFGSKLDEWIRCRSKSICLGNSWENILTEKLLKESIFEVDKINNAITLELTIDKSGNCNNAEFYLTTIKPSAEILPEHLEALLTRKAKSRVIPAKLKKIKGYIHTLEEIIHITKLINNKLIDNGHIQLDLALPDDDCYGDLRYDAPGGNHEGWNSKLNLFDPQSILNIICIYSNNILALYLSSINLNYICLNKNKQESIPLSDIIKSALVLDGNLTLDEEGLVSFHELMSASEESPNKRIIEKLIKNSIADFKYQLALQSNVEDFDCCDDKMKEAPWTSPGFNYADIINQFILSKLLIEGKITNHKLLLNNEVLENTNKAETIMSKAQLSILNKYCNESQIRELNTGRASSIAFKNGLISMIQLRSVEKNIDYTISGTITGVQSYGFFVELDQSLAEGLVHVSSLNDDWYEYRSRQNLLIGRKNKKSYQIGNNVNVVIEKIDFLRNQVDLKIVDEEDNSSENIDEVDVSGSPKIINKII